MWPDASTANTLAFRVLHVTCGTSPRSATTANEPVSLGASTYSSAGESENTGAGSGCASATGSTEQAARASIRHVMRARIVTSPGSGNHGPSSFPSPDSTLLPPTDVSG